jgi:hypothetical protein
VSSIRSSAQTACHRAAQRAVMTLLLSLALSSCGVDERDLSEGMPAASRGGVSNGGGGSSVAGGDAGESNSAANRVAGGQANGGHAGSGQAGGDQANGGHAGSGAEDGADSSGSGSVDGTTAGSGNSAGGPGCSDLDNDAVDDCAETLAQNSRFVLDTSAWTAESGATATWDPRDARMIAASGSMLVSNVAAVATAFGAVMLGADQCLSVTAGTTYELAARVLIASGQGSGEGGIALFVFDGAGCQGTFLRSFTPATTEAVDAWTTVEGQTNMPIGARSMLLRLVASRPFAQAKLDIAFDDVLVRALPTPVQ